jgi:hypothetical protein
MSDHVEYHYNPIQLLDKMRIDRALYEHIEHDKTVDDNFDTVLQFSVTHDATRGNEGSCLLTLMESMITRKNGTKFGVPVKVRWKVGTLKISEKRGKVPTVRGIVDGVAQHWQLPIKFEVY